MYIYWRIKIVIHKKKWHLVSEYVDSGVIYRFKGAMCEIVDRRASFPCRQIPTIWVSRVDKYRCFGLVAGPTHFTFNDGLEQTKYIGDGHTITPFSTLKSSVTPQNMLPKNDHSLESVPFGFASHFQLS